MLMALLEKTYKSVICTEERIVTIHIREFCKFGYNIGQILIGSIKTIRGQCQERQHLKSHKASSLKKIDSLVCC